MTRQLRYLGAVVAVGTLYWLAAKAGLQLAYLHGTVAALWRSPVKSMRGESLEEAQIAGHGVLVNAIAPGPIETPLVEGISEDWKTAKRAELPLGRFGRPEEVAPTAVLLASSPGGDPRR